MSQYVEFDCVVDEQIRIGNDIVLMVTSITCWNGKVRLGTRAPRRISVHREEIYQAILAEKKRAQAEKEKQAQPMPQQEPPE